MRKPRKVMIFLYSPSCFGDNSRGSFKKVRLFFNKVRPFFDKDKAFFDKKRQKNKQIFTNRSISATS
jgi:hypothetical protein